MTKVDPLTGLGTRVGLKEDLERTIAAGGPVSLALVDVDHFEQVNNDLGHAAGDQVLKALAALLADSKAVSGLSYRVSGDEFALLLPGKSLEQAFLHLEGLRKRVQESAVHFGLPDKREVTITIGVAQYPRDAKDEPALMRAADAALMSAKESSRNSVALPPNEEMIMKSCYYSATSIRRLKGLAEKRSEKESSLLREALDDLLRKYDKR